MTKTNPLERKIRIKLSQEADLIHLSFADSGIGVSKGMENEIFFPTVSTKANERGDIIGTGMGLSIVKGFVESYKQGKISVDNKCDLNGAQFHIWVSLTNQ